MEYVNNKQFLELIIEYRKTGSRKIYNKIGKIFNLIAENYLNKPFYINYTKDRKKEMISEATFMMCKYMYLFKEKKSKNPFGYFSMFAYNGINKWFKQRKRITDKFINISFIENFDKELM